MAEVWIKKTSGTTSRSTSTSVRLLYGADGYATQALALSAALADVLLTYGSATVDGLGLTAYTVDPDSERDSMWEVELTYGNPSGTLTPTPGTEVNTFDTTGETKHILQSRKTITRKARNDFEAIPRPAPDFKGAINVTADSVEGCDVIAGALRESVTKQFDVADVDEAFKAMLATMTGTVNMYPFRGFAAGEVLFLGATGQKRGTGNEPWEITFNFAITPNATNVVVPEDADPTDDLTINIGDIEGWDFLWFRFSLVEDTTGQAMTQRPTHAYVERVYRRTNFALLGIGG